MSKKTIQPGNVINVTLSGTVASGDVWVGKHIIGIYQSGGVSGDLVAVALSGVHQVVKTSGTAWLAGEKLLWDTSATKFDASGATPAAGDIMGACVAYAAAASGDLIGYALLTPGNATLT